MRLNSASVDIGCELQTKAPLGIRIYLLFHDALLNSLQAEVWMFFDFVAPKPNHRPTEVIELAIDFIVPALATCHLPVTIRIGSMSD